MICGAALRRQRREKRLLMAGGICCGPAENVGMYGLIQRWRQGFTERMDRAGIDSWMRESTSKNQGLA